MIIKIVLCIIGVYIFMWFAIPLTRNVTLNIGNLFGMIYSLLVIIGGILFDYLIVKIMLICMVLFLIPYLITIAKIEKATKQKDRECNAIIILGCRVKGDKPSTSLIQRCLAGARYIEKHPNAIAVVSGGQGSDELISEGECMAGLLKEYKIADEKVIKECDSTSTRENLIFSKRLLDERGITEPIAIVSSEYHLYRAGKIAKDCGINDTLLIPSKTRWYTIPTFYTREVFGIWARLLKLK